MEKYLVRVNGKEYEVEIEKVEAPKSQTAHFQKHEEASRIAEKTTPREIPAARVPQTEGLNFLEAGAAGKVFKIMKKAGESVQKGETVLILEAMKMEIPMVSTFDGTINEVMVSEGQPVEAGDRLVSIV